MADDSDSATEPSAELWMCDWGISKGNIRIHLLITGSLSALWSRNLPGRPLQFEWHWTEAQQNWHRRGADGHGAYGETLRKSPPPDNSWGIGPNAGYLLLSILVDMPEFGTMTLTDPCTLSTSTIRPACGLHITFEWPGRDPEFSWNRHRQSNHRLCKSDDLSEDTGSTDLTHIDDQDVILIFPTGRYCSKQDSRRITTTTQDFLRYTENYTEVYRIVTDANIARKISIAVICIWQPKRMTNLKHKFLMLIKCLEKISSGNFQ